MENETTRSTEGLLEPVDPGSVTFNESILAPLRNNYLYEESKECFIYNSAHLIKNDSLQKRYAAFRYEKREKGYSEQELEESFGFLLLDDVNRAKKVGETGLLVGQAKCTTLGDSLKGVYISKYSDCLDLKRWYDGKTGYIVLLKLTKGRVKEVTDNYTQNFTPPTPGFDCHISDQLGAVSSTTSSFLAYERTQYYLYELHNGSCETEQCPRHACPFAIVAFSYGKMSTTSESEQKSRDKTVFHYQPWIGQFKIESTVYDVGLQSTSGAWFPAKLPKTVKIDHAIGVSELKRTLPREIFETCIVGEVCIGGRCFNLYDVVSSKAKNDLAQIAQELKQKDMALVIPLEDSGFLVLLHSSHLFSYEDTKSGKAAALQGMFIFPDSRTVPRDAKSHLSNTKTSTEIMQVIPALNYAETEMDKCPPDQQGSSQASLEKHLQEYGTLFHTGPLDVPTREASMFPDQYDVPGGFTLISPKWSKETGSRLKSYFDEPCGFTIPIVRALELLTAGRQQRGDDHDDDVYYCISSPEEVPQTDAPCEMEVTKQTEAVNYVSDMTFEKAERQKDEHKDLSSDPPQPSLPEGRGKLGTAVVTVTDSVFECPTSTVSPKLGDIPTEQSVSIDTDVKKTSQDSTKGDTGDVCVDLSAKETPIQTCSTSLITSTKEADTAVSGEMLDNIHPEKTMDDPEKKVNQRSSSGHRGRKRKIHWKTLQIQKEIAKKLAFETSSLPLVLPVNSTDVATKGQTETLHADDIKQRPHSTSRGRGRNRKGTVKDQSEVRQGQDTLLSASDESVHDQSLTNEVSPKRDWRSLPRRKRLWNTDTSLKRSLRSGSVKHEKETILNATFDATKLSSTPKRKMEGFSLRERYGLKTIITNCGRVFVPHGSDVESGDMRQNEEMQVEMGSDAKAETVSPVENKSTETVESKGESPSTGKEELSFKDPVVNENEDSSDSTSKEMPSALLSALKILRKLHQNNPAENNTEKSMDVTTKETVNIQKSNKDCTVSVQAGVISSPPRDIAQSTHTDPKVSSPDKPKKKAKHGVYSAISISKLKTVLRRGKRVKSPSPGDNKQSEKDNPEPDSKKVKSNSIMDVKNDIIKSDLKDKGTQPVNAEAHHVPLKSVELTKQPVSWRGLIQKTSKENGSLNFDTSAPFEIAKHADQQLISSIIGDRVGRRRISFDGKASAEKLSTGASLPSDALSLLADLALGSSNDKMLTNLAKPGPEAFDGVKASGSAESVLHALLRYPAVRFKLPPRSPFPESLLATGELILEISKEHSYSQPTSPLSGLSGPSPQVSSASGHVESPLSLKTGLQLNLPKDAVASHHPEEGGKTEWKHLISPNMPLVVKTKSRRSRMLRSRRIIAKEGTIEVMRVWKEPYDFKFDSKFTNDNLDKTVSRALHGKWNFNIEDTFEDVHLIFHMWIGLFYSKATSRLFHLENCPALSKGKDVEKIHLDKNAIQNAVSSLNVELSSKERSPKPAQLSSDILDLSVKTTEPENFDSLSNQITSKDTVSPSGGTSSSTQEAAPKHSPAGKSVSPPPKVKAMTNYRCAVDISQQNSNVPERDDDTDDEIDTNTDCSYSQLLERNSAYSQLCEKASNMRIGIRVLLPKVRNVTNNDTSSKAKISDPKKIGVFHQILKPPLFSKPSRLILGRKSFDLGLKNETVARAVLQKKNVSESAETKATFKARGRKDGRPQPAVDGNDDKTSGFKPGDGSSISVQKECTPITDQSKEVSDEDSQEGRLMIEGGNVVENMTSKTANQDKTRATQQNEAAHEKEDLKTLPDLKDQANKADNLSDSLSHGVSVEEHSKTSKAQEALKPVHGLKDKANIVDLRDTSSQETSVEKHVETLNAHKELEPLPDDTNLVDHVDELSDISEAETKCEKDNENSNAKENLELVHNIKYHTDAVNELRDASSDETIVDERSNSKEEIDLKSHVVNTSSHVAQGNDTKGALEDKGYTDEEMQEDEKSKDGSNLDGSDAEHETATAMGEVADEFVLELNDDVNSVDMEFSDEDVENNAQMEVFKTKSPIPFIDDDHDIKLLKSDAQPQTPEEETLENDALKEFSNDSYSEDQPIPVQKKQAPAPISNSFDVMQDESETNPLEQDLLVPQEDLDGGQEESKPTSIVEPFKLGISDSESDEELDSVQQDVSEVKADKVTMVEENETRSQVSCVDHIIKIHQECLSPKICASVPNRITESSKEMVAPQDSRNDKPSEVEVNSMCSTPTQDEITCLPEVNEDFRKEALSRGLYYPVNSARVVHHDDVLPPKSPVSPHTHVSSTKSTSDFTGHYEETQNDERSWKKSRYLDTMNFKDKSALTMNSPSEDPFQYKYGSTSQEKAYLGKFSSKDDSELYYRDHNVDDLHGYYYRSEEDLPWADYQTEEQVDHQFYPCENNFSEEPICSKYITSEREFSYKPKKRSKKETDEYCWKEENYDPLSLKCPIKVTCAAENIPKKKSRKSKFANSQWENEYSSNDIVDYSISKASCFETYRSKPTRVVTVSSLSSSSKQQFDWSRYFRREATASQLLDVCERDNKFNVPPASIVTMLDKKGNRVTFSNSPTAKPSFSGSSLSKGLDDLKDSFHHWQEHQRKAEATRSTVDLEYLIFSKEMNQVLKETKSSRSSKSHCRSNPELAASPMTVRFSDLSDVESSVDFSKAQQSHTNFKIKVELSDRKGIKEPVKKHTPCFHRLFSEKGNEVEFAGISEITEQCAVEYKSMINDVCSKKAVSRPTKAVKRKADHVNAGKNPRFSGRIKKDIFVNPHDNLKSNMRQASKIKYRFYILVTSADAFFEETRNLMEMEGHKPVEPDEFDVNDGGQSPLLIILRNEDIAEHICEVPYLLELKKSPSVQFVGIDRPDDVVNLTHQELFAKGGFIVCDERALDTLTLDDMKKVVGILDELEKQGKWKWFVHYRDSRRLRESARSSPEVNKKQQFIDWCQKAGIVEVLPYHDCDVISRDRPDYFSCLTRLQIQNASIRFPVFITDTPTEAFGTNGILTMNIYTFSRILSKDTCSVS